MSSKPPNTRPSPHGISLANLSEPLSFGPALMPTLQPVGVSESVSTSAQQTPSSSSSTSANPSGMWFLAIFILILKQRNALEKAG
jgi:hypothetical protein